jgi:hypothetical protein
VAGIQAPVEGDWNLGELTLAEEERGRAA